MNVGTWIAISMPLFVIFFIILPHQRTIQRAVILKIKKKRGALVMSSELIKKYIGKNCRISTGAYGMHVDGKIIEVNDNWIEIETKKGNELMNSEFVQNIKIKSK